MGLGVRVRSGLLVGGGGGEARFQMRDARLGRYSHD